MTFAPLAARFAKQVDSVRHLAGARYVRPDWLKRNAGLEADLLPTPPDDFLCHPAIRFQMFVDEHVLPYELPYVRGRLDTVDLLAEDAVGSPPTVPLPDEVIRTSSNTVHQLFHLLRYEQATGKRVSDATTIVEWGGGFGSLMRLIVRMHGHHPTCVIIDTPIFSALQWLYLSAVLGEDRIVLHTAVPVMPIPNRINIVPIGLLSGMEVQADLFISNWALNESLPAAQRDVIARNWFGADSLLLAMHAGDPLFESVLGAGARPIPVGDFMPGQHYLVA